MSGIKVDGTPKASGLRRLFGTLGAILRQRCPRCRKGPMFRGPLTMNDPCPNCGLMFQREEGYFLGAMYVSSLLAYALVVPTYFLLAAWLPKLDGITLAFWVCILYLPFWPLVWRYSRVLWVYFDRATGSRDVTPYERFRQQELARQAGAPDPASGSAAKPENDPPRHSDAGN
jgi:uncharacterized protein (DUF983 family)